MTSVEPGNPAPSAPGWRMLTCMWDAFSAAGEWPIFQFVSARVFRDEEPDPRDIYIELSERGFVRPHVRPERAFEVRSDTRGSITLKGLMFIADAQPDLGRFVSSVRYLGARAASFQPSNPTTLEHLTISSEEIRLSLPLGASGAEMQRQLAFFREYAHQLWTGLSGPDADGRWSITLNIEYARHFRHIQTLIEFLEVQQTINERNTPVLEPPLRLDQFAVAQEAEPILGSTAVRVAEEHDPDLPAVLIAAQVLEENIEDLRRRVARAVDKRVFWVDLLVWNIFDVHKAALQGSQAYKPVADAYRSFRELNEEVPEARLGTPIPDGEIDHLQAQLGILAHASETLNTLAADLRIGARPQRASGHTSAPPSSTDGDRAGHPTAFISWAHGDADWQDTILAFAHRLRELGIDCDVDLFHLHDHDVNWATYGATAIKASDFVLIASSSTYKQRWEGTNDPTSGAGAAREANVLKTYFDRDQATFRRRVKLVILPGSNGEDVPDELYSAFARFELKSLSDEDFEPLLRTLTQQPAFPRPPLGPIAPLPPRFGRK